MKMLIGKKALIHFYWDVVLFWDEVRRGVYVREPFITAFLMITFCPIYWYSINFNEKGTCLGG